MTPRNCLAAIGLIAFATATPLAAQDAAIPITLDRAVSDSLGADGVHAYTLDLADDRFVFGEADQHTMDVVITVKAPNGKTIERIDFSARGTEPFQFDAEEPGTYRIEVSPFQRQTGRYTLVVRRIERLATEPAARVDQLMAAYSDPATPGAVIGVVRDGRLTFARAYGAANLTHDIPFTVETVTNIGSTSKQFTAFAIVLLAERGELSLDDDVRQHIPELPDLGHTVTLRNLVTHTSGYREFLNAFALAGRRLDQGDHIGRDEIIGLIERQPSLQNEPGAEWNYNNSGFALLTVVVERVTGESFPDWMRENVFEPLGMEHTVVRAMPSQIVPNSAQGYTPAREGGWREAADLGGAMGAGGIYTTVGDLAVWMRNFEAPRVGPADAFGQLTDRFVLTSGDTTEYGLGLFVDEYRGLRRIHHGGADVAHRSMLEYFPEIDAGVIVLSNNASFNAGAITNRVADAFFEDRMESRDEDEGDALGAVAGEFDPAEMDSAAFAGFEGRFALISAPSFIIDFSREGDTFHTQATGQPRLEMVPTSDSTFSLVEVAASVTFHRTAEGRADSVTLNQGGASHAGRRVAGEEWEPTLDDLAEYVGRYYSRELETFYEVSLADSALVLRHRRLDEPLDLTPTKRDEFTGEFPVASLRFLRNERDLVIGLEVGNGRTRDVRFDRIGGWSLIR